VSRFRILFAIFAAAILATALVACGGGGDSGNEDPQQVLDQTFSSDNEDVNSGNLDISLGIDVSGDQGGSFDASVSGPFESQGKNKIPKFDLDAKVDTSGQGQDVNFEGGLISTGDSAFVGYNGTDYEIDKSLFDQFQAAFESAAAQNAQQTQNTGDVLKQLGIDDPKSLLTNLSNDGDTDVEGTETTHISGDLDVNKTVDAFKSVLSNAGALGSLGGVDTSQLPTPAQLDQVKSAIKQAHFDIYSGKDDHILRRFTITLSIEPPSGSGVDTIDVNFDLTIGGVNESQTIEAPSNPKPFSDLLSALGVPAQLLDQLGGGALGNLGGSSGGTGSGTPSVPDLGGSAQAQQAQKYLQCIAKANSAADLQACQGLAP
jgi:hypothetical protein